jgi:hypothetical protein
MSRQIIRTRVLNALSQKAAASGLTATEIAFKLYPSTNKPERTSFAESVNQHAGVYNAIRELEMEHRLIPNTESPPRYTITSRGKESHKD